MIEPSTVTSSTSVIGDSTMHTSEHPSHPARHRGATSPRALQIGIDATCWNNNRGYGRHARALLSALLQGDDENQYTLFFDAPPSSHPPSAKAKLSFITSREPASLAASARDTGRCPT